MKGIQPLDERFNKKTGKYNGIVERNHDDNISDVNTRDKNEHIVLMNNMSGREDDIKLQLWTDIENSFDC